MMKLEKKHILAALIVALLLAVWMVSGLFSKVAKQRSAPVQVVTVVPVKSKTLTDVIEAVGVAKANESVTITAQVSELVRKIHFKDGALVKKGEVIIQLDNQKAMADYQEWLAKYKEEDAQYGRFFKLFQRKAVSQAQLDTQKQKVTSAKFRLLAAKNRLDEHTIIAPFDGMLGFRDISEGSLLRPGSTITTIDDIHTIKVSFTVPERYFAQLKKGMEIVARSTAYPDRVFKGTVDSINPRIDPVTRAVQLRGLIPNEDLLLRPGMLLNIDIQASVYEALYVPTEAILTYRDKKFVYVVEKNKTVKRVEIQTGKLLNGNIVVTEGVSAADTIVDKGAFKLSAGDKIHVVKELNDES